MSTTEVIIAIIVAVFGSTGFWTAINTWLQNRSSRKSVERDALLGLLHQQLYSSCMNYIHEGSISVDDLEELEKYLWLPYRELGGNGTCEALFKRVQQLQLKD